MAVSELLSPSIPVPLHPRRWAALSVVSTGMFVAILDVFIVHVALPSIQLELRATDVQIQLVVAAYTVSYAVLLITGGRLGDRVGRKRLFSAGLLLFSLASMACGLAPTATILIAARAVQGMGAALMVPQIFSIIQVTFDETERPKALGVYGGVVGLASMLGQTLGALLLQANVLGLGWRTVFMINVPVGLGVFVLARSVLMESTAPEHGRLDIRGLAMGASIVTLVLVPLLAGRSSGWAWWNFAALGAAVALSRRFMRSQHNLARAGGHPTFVREMFSQSGFSRGLAVLFLAQGGLAAFLFTMTLHLQLGLRAGVVATGLALFAPAAAYVATSLAVAKRYAAVAQRLPRAGSLVMVTGYALLLAVTTATGADTGAGDIVGPCAIIGVGLGMVFTPSMNRVMSSAHPAYVGRTSGMISTVIQLGNVFGVAVLGSVFLAVRGPAHASFESASVQAFWLVIVVLMAVHAIVWWLTEAAGDALPGAPQGGRRE